MSMQDVLKQIEGSRDLNMAYYRQTKAVMVETDDYREENLQALHDFKQSASIYAACAKLISEALHE